MHNRDCCKMNWSLSSSLYFGQNFIK
jgi:hypothetical protein